MTIRGHIESCEPKAHGKSAKVRLQESQTGYTLFDMKLVPALQPGVHISFEPVQREYQDTKYWAIADGSVHFLSAEKDLSTEFANEYAERLRQTPPMEASDSIPGATLELQLRRIASTLERFVELYSRREEKQETKKNAPFNDDLPF